MEDPLTGHFPSRTLIDEEEEREAQQWAGRYATPPQLKWHEDAQAHLKGQVLPADILIVATSPAACALLERCLQSTSQVVGSLWQPEILQEAPVALRALVEGPAGRDAATQLLYSPRDRTAVALCSSLIPPERAAAWVEGMLSHVEAQHAVVVASLPAREYIGVGDPTQESLQYVLESTAATGSCTHGLPYLPTGNLVSGLPAALMSCCQVQQRAATLLLSVDASPMPDSSCIQAIARALTKLLSSLGAAELAAQARRPDVVSDVCKSTKQAARLSDRAALYL
ncbi:g13442 [Coccomyxa viridis]|uniref:G13442 protein n=1 Tax=Coccomyxa viridis TaxID=1274662 RepID=A0ABP1GI92_9CHLO